MNWSSEKEILTKAEVKANELSLWSDSFVDSGEVAIGLHLDVAPKAETTIRLLVQKSFDGVTWARAETAGAFVVDKDGLWIQTVVVDVPYVRFAIKPLEYGIKASLSAVSR